MSWYSTEEQAIKIAKMKTDKWGEEFVVLKDSEHPDCWWAQRKSALNDD